VNIISKFFKTKDNKIVIFQFPNIPIILFIIFYLLSLVFNKNMTGDIFRALYFGFLFTWCYLEIFQGVNYLRRVLGFTVLILSVISMARII
jgi:hypothetical protein